MIGRHPVKILHVIPSTAAARGGPSAVVRTMALCEAERGMEVHIATTDDDGPGRMDVRTDGPVTDGKLTYWYFPRQTHFYTVSFPLTLWLWKHSVQYDVIHIHALFSYPSVIAAVCANRASIPYVVRPLGTLSQWGMSHRRPWFKRLSFRWIESRILKHAAAVHFTSQQEALEADLLHVPYKGIVIPNPVELPRRLRAPGAFRTRHPSLAGKMVLLFLSRLDPKKGLDLLLPAFSSVLSQNSRVVLVIAGDGDPVFVASLKQQALQLGLGDSVLWVGFLQGEEKRAALADSDLYVLPSYSENFGVAVVEAMGAGVPVVVSDQVGIHREIANVEAGLVVECNVKSLAVALMLACESVEWRAAASEKAIHLAARFTPALVGEQLADLYDQIRIKNRHSAAA